MISIIICSRKEAISQQLSDNIEKTISSAYELIIIDNSENRYSIFEAYNLGIQRSKGEFLCFVHDDVLFHTQDWGKVLSRIFESDPKIGLIGIAGAKIKTKMPSAWWECPKKYHVINIIQHLNSDKKEFWDIGWDDNVLEEVVAIDGVLMVARKDKRIKFSHSLSGFHNYDLNMSFEYLKHDYKIVVSREILIEHFSLGKINSSWYVSTSKLHDLYKRYLPFTICDMLAADITNLEFANGSVYLENSIGRISKLVVLKNWLKLIRIKPYSKFHYKFLKKLLR